MIRKTLAALALACALLSAAPAVSPIDTVGTAQAQTVCKSADLEARVYGMTGLLGQVGGFSLGVFTELDNIQKAQGCKVKTYKRSHLQSSGVYETAKANYRIDKLPIFLIGHSMGADAAISIAHRLKADRIPVATIFAYDPTQQAVPCVPSNVQTAIGWRGTLLFNLGRGQLHRCPDIPAGAKQPAIEDHPLAVSHVFIDDLPTVHALTTKHVGEVLHMVKEQGGSSSAR